MGNSAAVDLGGPLTDQHVLSAISRLRDLPASTPVVHRALCQFDDPNFAVENLKKILLGDPAVSARILRLANSAYFGFRSEVQTVSQAVVLLGQDRIRTLLRRLLIDSVITTLAQGRTAAAPIRRMSLATATASSILSQLLSNQDVEEMLLAGLLHNIGDLFFLSQFAPEYWRVGQLAEQVGHREATRTVFGMTSGHAGSLLLESWRFPPLYTTVTEHVDSPEGQSSAVVLVHAGKKLAEAFIGALDVVDAVERVAPQVCEQLSLAPELLAEVYHALPQRMSMEQLQASR